MGNGNDATVKFGYDGKELDAGMRDQERRMNQHSSRVESTFTRMGKGINRALESVMSLKGLAAGAGITGMISFGKAALETYDQVASESKKLNTSAETLQRLGHAAEILGNTDLETLSKGLLKLRRQLIDDPAGEMAKGLEEIGLKAEDFLRLDADAQMLTLADAFGKASESGRALPLLTSAMGKGFAELIPLLSGGREELQKFMDESVVMSNSAVAAADELNDKFDVMTGKIGHVAKALALATASGLSEMMGMSPRTEIDATGSKAASAAAEANAANQAKRDAEAKSAAIAATKASKELLNNRNRELDVKRQNIKLAREGVEIMELELQGRSEEAKILKEKSFITKRAHEHSATGLDAGASIALAAREFAILANQQRRAEAEKLKAQKAEQSGKKETLSMERKSVDLLEAEAKGQTRKVEKLKTEAYITQRMKELSGLGISATEAEGMARRELKAMKEKEKYAETGRAHIGGVKSKKYMGSTFHGLDDFARMQEKDYEPKWTAPTRPGYRKGQPVPRYDAFGRDNVPPTSAQRTGRYMGGDRAGTRSFADTTVAATAQSQVKAGGSVAEKIDVSNNHLKVIAEAMV